MLVHKIFFGKNPYQTYTIIATLLVIASISSIAFHSESILEANNLIVTLANFVLMAIHFLVLYWVYGSNHKHSKSKQVMVFFCCFLLMFHFPEISNKTLSANLFLLIALKHIFSLSNLKNMQLKIFNASLCIFFASLLEFWSINFIFLLYFAIVYYNGSNYKNWLIPLVALFTISVLIFCASFFISLPDFDFLNYQNLASFDFQDFSNQTNNVVFSVFTTLSAFILLVSIGDSKSLKLNARIVHNIVVCCAIIGWSSFIFSSEKNNELLLFSFFPLANLAVELYNKLRTLWIKEVSIILLLVTSFCLFYLHL